MIHLQSAQVKHDDSLGSHQRDQFIIYGGLQLLHYHIVGYGLKDAVLFLLLIGRRIQFDSILCKGV